MHTIIVNKEHLAFDKEMLKLQNQNELLALIYLYIRWLNYSLEVVRLRHKIQQVERESLPSTNFQ